MNRLNAKLAVAVAVAGSWAGWAGWNPDAGTYDTTGYIQMKTSESGNTSSYATGTNWDPPAPTAAGNKYYVQKGKQLRLLSSGENDASQTFKGDVLALSGTLSGPCTKVHIPHLDLLAGSTICIYSTPIAYEDATIGVYPASSASYVKIDHGVANCNDNKRETRGWVLNNVKLVGPKEAYVYFDNARSNSVGYVNFKSGCDVSEYFGTIAAVSHPEFLHDAGGGVSFAGVKFGPDITGFPGTIVLGTNSVLDVTNVTEAAIATSKVEINNLTALAGAEFRIANGSAGMRTISVTNAFVHDEGPVRLVFDRFGCAYQKTGFTPSETPLVPFRVKVAEGDAGVEPSLAVSDFTITDFADSLGLPRFDWSVKRADGWDSLVCEGHKVVVKSNASDGENVYSTTNAAAWSDGELPHFGADYYLGNALRLADSAVNFWGENEAYKSKDPSHVNKTYVWQGDSVTLRSCNMQFTGVNGMFVTNMTIAAGSSMTMYGPKFRLYTVNPVLIVPVQGNYVTFYVYNGSEVHVERGITGAGDVWCEYRGKNFSVGRVEFPGANTNFTGKVLLACKDYTKPTSADYTPRETNRVEVIVSDGRNLGGALPAFAYDALRIRDWSLLDVTNTTAFAETTRGVFIDWAGCISVSGGKTASFAAPFTFGGVLKKQGEGTLALGGAAPKFATGPLDQYEIGDEPVAGTNVLVVAAGAVKPLSATAFDGLELRFAANAQLRLDVDPADEDLKARGLVNTKWTTPFVAPDGGKIAVGFDAPADGIRDRYEVAICTVSKAAVADPAALFQVNRPTIGGHRYAVETAVVDNGDGTVTLKAQLFRSGLVILFR